MISGEVKGRRIHGHNPEDIDPATSQIEVGRGRGIFIPSMPWEGTANCHVHVYANCFWNFLLKMQKYWRVAPEKR